MLLCLNTRFFWLCEEGLIRVRHLQVLTCNSQLRQQNPSAAQFSTTLLLKSAITVVQLQLIKDEQKQLLEVTPRTFVLFV